MQTALCNGLFGVCFIASTWLNPCKTLINFGNENECHVNMEPSSEEHITHYSFEGYGYEENKMVVSQFVLAVESTMRFSRPPRPLSYLTGSSFQHECTHVLSNLMIEFLVLVRCEQSSLCVREHVPKLFRSSFLLQLQAQSCRCFAQLGRIS